MTFQGEIKKRTYKNVYNFWQNEGKKRGNGIFATLRDHYFRLVEITTILKELKKQNNKLLDIGCGNGISTFFFHHLPKKLLPLITLKV